ncbi:MAG: hypothetical protein QM482_04905 [Sulfurospirillum sp.]
MSLKENINSIKEEIGAEEQFLESIIKGERFYKKYKRQIQVSVVAIILFAIGYTGYGILKDRNLRISNEAYETLSKAPNNKDALATLKDKNPSLYKVFLFKEAIKTNNIEKLETLSKDKDSELLSDLSLYQIAQLKNSKVVNSKLLKGFSLLEEGFDLLKNGKITEAKLKFAQIDPNSPLSKIVKNLEHYQGKTK